MQFRPKIKQVQNHRMSCSLDTPLKGRSMGCTLNRQSDSTKQQREGHNMQGLLQPRLEHKSAVKNKCFDRGAEHLQPQSKWHQSRTITVENARNSGPGMKSASRKSKAVQLHDILTYTNWIRFFQSNLNWIKLELRKSKVDY